MNDHEVNLKLLIAQILNLKLSIWVINIFDINWQLSEFATTNISMKIL